jgi:replicative DNA helicase
MSKFTEQQMYRYDLERKILAVPLLPGANYHSLFDLLKVKNFANKTHRALFHTYAQLWPTTTINTISVRRFVIQQVPNFDEIFGENLGLYLAILQNEVSSDGQIDTWVILLLEESLREHAIGIVSSFLGTDHSYNEEVSCGDIFIKTAGLIDRISNQSEPYKQVADELSLALTKFDRKAYLIKKDTVKKNLILAASNYVPLPKRDTFSHIVAHLIDHPRLITAANSLKLKGVQDE